MASTISSSGRRAPKVGDVIADELRRQIVSGQLCEGDALPSEAELMQHYGVSRPTLREAIRVLESERIVRIKRGAGGGAYAQVPDSSAAGEYAGTLLQYLGTTVEDLHRARAQLESACVGVLAATRKASDLRELDRSVAEGAVLQSDPVAYVEGHELQFHRLLVELTGNQTMVVLLDMLFSIVESHNKTYMRAQLSDETAKSTVPAAQRLHVRVVGLIREKASVEAVALWRKHLAQIGDQLIPDPEAALLDVLP